MASTLNVLPEYNGWPNYPTWAVHGWLTNDEFLYRNTLDVLEYAEGDKAEALKHFVEELVAEQTDERANLASDLAQWALGYVDWKHIVEVLEE